MPREFRDRPTADGLAHEEITPRGDGHHMQERELAGPMAGTTEPAEDRLGCVVEDPHDLVATVGLVHERLLSIGREIDVPRRPRPPDRLGPGHHGNRVIECAILLVYVA